MFDMLFLPYEVRISERNSLRLAERSVKVAAPARSTSGAQPVGRVADYPRANDRGEY
ncbi:hypothetical protein ACFVTJ_10765 [Agrobacterium sp. NPDC058088]|uniref:hypothetical protein n=1 Tax=Agrobacterium sp. NPDC058088 TaxID=3346335 RepID=UPI0036DA2A22